MTRPLLLALLLALGGLAACSPAPEDTRPGQPVKTRQSAFKDILRAFEPMGTMLRTDRYDADAFAALAKQLAARRDAPWTHFGADTDYPPSKSKPAVWRQPEDFARERDNFLAATDALLAAAQSRDKATVAKAYDQVHGSCKSCHKQFKNS